MLEVKINHNNLLIINFSKKVMDYAREIAKAGLNIGAIKLNPKNPFTWASDYRMPIYNDNRMFLFSPSNRRLVEDALEDFVRYNIKDSSRMVIAGTSTAGIPWGTTLADRLESDFVYVRDKPKDHGLRNQIEGIDPESDLNGRQVLLIEDLVSTGGSSIKAVQAIRDAKGDCRHCISIFNYELNGTAELFNNLNPPCKLQALLTYAMLIETARDENYILSEQVEMLEEWRKDPFNWGERHGFPRVDKK